ncbi:MAG: type II toxin-antitoxin system Phd/YefM family antitoxin [Solirubrobacteraceae bacterium]
MDSMSISSFKATCLAELERVRRTGRPLLVTRRGEPVAQIIPPPLPQATESAFGAMRGKAEELADVVAPVADGDWEALQ